MPYHLSLYMTAFFVLYCSTLYCILLDCILYCCIVYCTVFCCIVLHLSLQTCTISDRVKVDVRTIKIALR